MFTTFSFNTLTYSSRVAPLVLAAPDPSLPVLAAPDPPSSPNFTFRRVPHVALSMTALRPYAMPEGVPLVGKRPAPSSKSGVAAIGRQPTNLPYTVVPMSQGPV
jgi:hypothetical protein